MRALFVMLGRRDLITGGYAFNWRMVEFLRGKGAEVEVIHYSTVPEGLPERKIRASLHVYRRIREMSPDVVIVAKSYQYIPLFRLLRRSLGIPVVYLVHSIEWRQRSNALSSRLYRLYARWSLGMARAVWANSSNTRTELEKAGIPADRITVISPGFQRPVEPPPDRSDRSGPVRLLCVGNLVPGKAQHVLVRACAALDPGSFELDLVGGDDSIDGYGDRISALTEELHLGDSVRMRGELDAETLDRAYRKADILIHPSVWESYGMCLVEAMARGLPVIASDTSAVPELIVDGETGLLVPPGDTGLFSDAIMKLMNNRKMRLELGANAYRYSQQCNDWNDTGRQFFGLVAGAAGWKISTDAVV